MSGLELYLHVLPLLLGALIGSFLNVVIVRWPAERSIVTPRSACPVCETPIAWYDNIPLLSYAILRGRCRHCGTSISWRYPAVEALTAFLCWLTFQRFIPTPMHFEGPQVAAWLLYFALVAGLLAITVIDFEHYLIPDEISLGGIPVGILGVLGLDYLGSGIIRFEESVLGAIIGAGVLAAVRGLYFLLRKQEGMGLGDVKMMGLLGAFLGYHPALMFIIFVSSMLGSVVGITLMLVRKEGLQYALPFGPFLAIAGVIYLLGGSHYAAVFIPMSTTPLPILP
ncbi:MAG: prepilin peptidase [Myxococcota bacterium]